MPPREWRLRIEDILESIARIDRYTAGLDATAFAADQLIADAVLRNFTIIGEAARHVPAAIVARYPDVPWTEMRGMRNLLIHEYFGASAATVWESVRHDLPPLIAQLRRILDENRDAQPLGHA